MKLCNFIPHPVQLNICLIGIHRPIFLMIRKIPLRVRNILFIASWYVLLPPFLSSGDGFTSQVGSFTWALLCLRVIYFSDLHLVRHLPINMAAVLLLPTSFFKQCFLSVLIFKARKEHSTLLQIIYILVLHKILFLELSQLELSCTAWMGMNGSGSVYMFCDPEVGRFLVH